MNDTEVEQQVRQYLVSNLRFHGSPETLSSDYRLIERGVLDSMGIFEVVSFLENHYGIQIEDHELIPQNFESLRAIARLVTKKGAG